MTLDAKYITDIQSRTPKRFWLGVLARVKNYCKNRYAVYIARKKGAIIGECVSLPLALAKRANSNLKVGSHTSIQTELLDMRAPVTIGNNVIIGSGVNIITASHNIDSPEWEYKSYGIVIDDFVWIATNVLVLPSCRHIGYGAVIAGGAVLPYNVSNMNVMTGNPAIVLRKRKEVHYNLCVESLLGNDLMTYLKVRKKSRNVN